MATATGKRQAAASQRRQAILDAALDIFAAEGFAAARLDEIAERAGVAKGTIYLSFRDKEDLFEQILVSAIAPILAQAAALSARHDLTFDEVLAQLFSFFQSHVLSTRRREVIRLVLSEGPRFPRIAEIYHREVISKGLEMVRLIARRAREKGEITSDELTRFPQLVFAPMLLAIVWDSVFSKIQPLDVAGLLAAHRTLLTKARAPEKKATKAKTRTRTYTKA